jgi:hypothetical protein
MLKLLDNLLRQILMDGVSGLREIPMNQPSAPVTESQVGFGPPDNQWRLDLQRNALNVYLVDLRENRKLRSNERLRSVENGVVYEDPAPARLDCHYLISAWSRTEQIAPQVEPVLDEHALLYEAAAVLIKNAPLNPSRVYPPGSQALKNWELFSDIELPTVIAPVEGFPKLAEFWGAMGVGHRWKPVMYLIVTVPVELLREVQGPMVTTRIIEYRLIGSSAVAEALIEIGGEVFLNPRVVAVGSAIVNDIRAGGTLVTVDDAAPFSIGDVITHNSSVHTTITHIAANDLTLSRQLPDLAVSNIVRIANISPSQNTFRLNDVTGLVPGGTALISGEDAVNLGATIIERATIREVSAGGFVSLAVTPDRSRTFNLNVPDANAPTVRGLAAGAWVRLEDLAGTPIQTTSTDKSGRFKFAGLIAGSYVLQARAVGSGGATRNIQVPSATGNYDAQL